MGQPEEEEQRWAARPGDPPGDLRAFFDAAMEAIDLHLWRGSLVEVAELAVGDVSQVRENLVDLLDAQVGGEARITEVVIDDDFATVVFDVVVELSLIHI